MFAAPTSAARSHSRMAGAYKQVAVHTGVDGASSHALILMLFDGFQEAVSRARGAMAAGELEAKGRAIAHAVRIVEEGLRTGLNLRDGGQLAADLDGLYTYVCVRLTHANLAGDDAALQECARLLEPVREAWVAIGATLPPAARAA
jgi:flagellar secretion chaperone FliS